jgi:putative PIN family toxin of toxin-antitoxin system
LKPRRVVFDTNILLSALLLRGNPRALFETVRAGRIQLITSPAILAELASVLKDRFFWEDNNVREALMAVGRHVELVKPKRTRAAVRDDADKRVQECASEANADLIISGDRRLLEQGEFRGIPILRASAFLATLC